MSGAKFYLGATLLTIAILASAACAQDQGGLPPPAVVDEWLRGPEQHAPGWNVQVRAPALTFRLRYAVAIRAHGDIAKAHLASHELHVFVRVTDGEGWTSRVRHSSVANLPNRADLEVMENFYALPGTYRVAIILYDVQAKRHGTWFKSVEVPEGERLPDYDNAPPVDFISPEGPFVMNVAPRTVPIETHRPERLDIVLNLTERVELELSHPNATRSHRWSPWGFSSPDWMLDRAPQDVVSEGLLGMGELLAAWRPEGCVRVSAFDAIRAKTYLDRASSFTAQEILEELRSNRNTAAVDARTLALRRKAGDFFRSFLQNIIDDHSGCESKAAPATRSVIVISDEMVFPEGEPLQSAEPAAGQPMRVYLLRLAIPDFGSQFHFEAGSSGVVRMSSGRFDQVSRLVQDLHPQRFDITQPRDFQKLLPHLRDEMSSANTSGRNVAQEQ